jgi:methionyl-tRNA formyltransferase
MKITILCSDPNHPINSYLEKWMKQKCDLHNIEMIRNRSELSGGDILFLISCSEIISVKHRSLYQHTLVLHASDLPKGRGWSPHVWEIVNGADHITLSLLEAEDQVDSGKLWLKCSIPVSKTELWYEVNDKLFEAEIYLMNEAIEKCKNINPYSQAEDVEPTYYRRRTPEDSEIDTGESIAAQFDLLRMCDPDRYPAWFEYLGKKYKVRLEVIDNEKD